MRPTLRQWAVALSLLALSIGTTTTLGAVWMVLLGAGPPPGPASATAGPELLPYLTPATIAQVWSDPRLLGLGLAFSLPALGILFCHEMGHWLACRYYRLPSTLPLFLPLPLGLGTLGAFIKIRSPIRTKRELFDVGIAGPLAGFVALVPFLILGMLWSEPVSVRTVDVAGPLPEGAGYLFLPGKSLALGLVSLAVHGPLGPDQVLRFHPFAVAAWFGLLATSLNLIPLGQLDGGHVLYSALGPLQRRLAFPLWLALAATAFLWLGWIVWCLLTLAMGLHHPPVIDERQPLDPKRRLLSWLTLLLLLLSFMPVPIRELVVY